MPLPSISTLIALTLSIAGHCVHQPYPVSVNLESADCQLLTLHLMSYVRKCSVRDLYSDTAPEKVWIQVPCSWTLLLYFVSRFRVQGVVVSVDLTNSSLILGDCTPLLQRLIIPLLRIDDGSATTTVYLAAVMKMHRARALPSLEAHMSEHTPDFRCASYSIRHRLIRDDCRR